jgi:Tfp pilus assembly protein PilZ
MLLMPGDYIENPRRAPRAPVRCEARLALRDGGYFASATRDYGPGGCQVPTPVPLKPGSRIFVELSHTNTPMPFRISGRVAWASSDPTPRAGIAFDDASRRPAANLYDRLIGADATVVGSSFAPDRIPLDAEIAPAPPPDPAPALTEEDVAVLTAVGGGLTVEALRARLGARWETAVYATFALLGRRLLVMGPPDPSAAAAWSGLIRRR